MADRSKLFGRLTGIVRGASLAGALGVVLLLGAVPASAANGWSAVQEPSLTSLSPAPNSPPNSEVISVSCTSATTCTAVGFYATSGTEHSLIETESAGTWSAVQEPSLTSLGGNPTIDSLSGVSCTSAFSCTAVGTYYDATTQTHYPLIETESAGTWSAVQAPSLASLSPAPQSHPEGLLTSVSCTSATNCTAVGNYNDASGGDDALILTESAGTWSAVQEPSLASLIPAPNSPPNSQLLGVSCTSATSCTAVGTYDETSSSSHALIVTESAGTWSAVQKPSLASLIPAPNSPPLDALTSVSCTSATTCTAVGLYEDTSGNFDPLIETESAGTWSAVQGPSLSSLNPAATSSSPFENFLNGVSCTSATSCTAVGRYEDTSGGDDPLILTESAGTWSAVQEPSLASLIPAPNSPPLEALFGVSCTSATSCTAMGAYVDTSGGADPLILTEAQPQNGNSQGQNDNNQGQQ